MSCCDPITSGLYSEHDTRDLPAEAVAVSLGCGNPTALAALHPGEVVLDLATMSKLQKLAALLIIVGPEAAGKVMKEYVANPRNIAAAA